jgi:hypothetical protein
MSSESSRRLAEDASTVPVIKTWPLPTTDPRLRCVVQRCPSSPQSTSVRARALPLLLSLDSVFMFLPMPLFAICGLPYQNDSNLTGPRNSLGALRHSNLPSWILANGERGSYIFLKRSVHSLAVLFPDTRSHTDSCSAQQVHELVDEWNLESLGALLAPI